MNSFTIFIHYTHVTILSIQNIITIRFKLERILEERDGEAENEHEPLGQMEVNVSLT